VGVAVGVGVGVGVGMGTIFGKLINNNALPLLPDEALNPKEGLVPFATDL
jgi:hypothetical protein